MTTNGEHGLDRIVLRTHATTVGSGPFHPAIDTGDNLLYWPNITFSNEDDAFQFAQEALERVWRVAEIAAQEWNIRSWK